MNKKLLTAIMGAGVILIMFMMFWNSTFSVSSDHDVKLFIGCGCAVALVAMGYGVFKKNIIIYILTGVLCIGILVVLIMYRSWNREGYYIDPSEVESIVHSYISEEWVNGQGYPEIENDYTDEKDTIVSKYNGVVCVKNWDLLGDWTGIEEYLYINLKDGTRISIEPAGYVNISNRESGISRKFKISVRLKELLP